jgi:hypothetical protein
MYLCTFLQIPYKTRFGDRKPNTADWLNLLRTGMPYAFGGLGSTEAQSNLVRMTDLLNKLLDATADYDAEDPTCTATIVTKCRQLRKQTVETLCLFERDFPASELSPFIHEILHVSEFIFRWNAVRNYWCFVTERFVGWMKGFVKNRYLSLQNMVHTNTHIHITTSSHTSALIRSGLKHVHTHTHTHTHTPHIHTHRLEATFEGFSSTPSTRRRASDCLHA